MFQKRQISTASLVGTPNFDESGLYNLQDRTSAFGQERTLLELLAPASAVGGNPANRKLYQEERYSLFQCVPDILNYLAHSFIQVDWTEFLDTLQQPDLVHQHTLELRMA